jgi:hypothetical protein
MIVFLVDGEEKLVIDNMHVFALVRHVEGFRLEHFGLDARLAEEFDQGALAGKATVCAEQFEASILGSFLVRGHQVFLGLGDVLVINRC